MGQPYIPKKGSRLGPFIAKVGITETARQLGLSVSTVRRWIESDAVPWAHIPKLARIVDEDIPTLLPLGGVVKAQPKRLKKTPEALDTLEKAYRGEPYEIKPPLTAVSLNKTLKIYGDRVPLLVATLKAFINREMTVKQATEALGIKDVTLHQLRGRYWAAPGLRKKRQKHQALTN